MSMIGCFVSMTDQDLEVIVESPELIHRLLGGPQPVKKPSLLSRLFGGKASPSTAQTDNWQPSQPRSFDVDKAWQGIHFLLTGSAWEGEGPLAFILHGGREIAEDLGYGSAHGFTSTEIKEINAQLEKVDPAVLFEKADPTEFAKQEIYPECWTDEPKDDSIGYIIQHLVELKKFIAATAQSDRALIAYLG